MITPDISSSTKSARKNRFLWMNRSESWKNTKRKNLQSAGLMNWQNCIIRMEILRSVLVFVMKWFSGSVTENTL